MVLVPYQLLLQALHLKRLVLIVRAQDVFCTGEEGGTREG